MSKDVLGTDSATIAAFMRGPVADLVGKAFGSEGTKFRFELNKFLKKQPSWVEDGRFPVDRTEQFDPEPGAGGLRFYWVWRGPLTGDGFNGERQEDTRSLALNEIDLKKVRCVPLEEACKEGLAGTLFDQQGISKFIRLDAQVFLTFWENQFLIPEIWKGRRYSSPIICFPGTVILQKGQRNYSFMFTLRWDQDRHRWCEGLVAPDGLRKSNVLLALYDPN